MAKKIKGIVLVILGLILAAGVIYAAPKVSAIIKLKDNAKELVKNSSESTFKSAKTTLVYDNRGNEIFKIKNDKDLYYVPFQDIPQTITDAFVVMEDQDFYTHNGIDYKAIVRAAFANQKSNQIVQGASTITQQLARNTFLSHEVSWERKIEEMFIAWELEKKYEKEQILEYYLNNIYFGNGYYGVEAASRGYFSKSVSELSLSEQAFIAAIPNNPSLYDPLSNYDNTQKRKNLILSEMYSHDLISSMDYYVSKEEVVVLNMPVEKAVNNSVITYVRHCATESLMSEAGFSFRYSFSSDSDYEGYQELYDIYYTRCQQKLLGGGYLVFTAIDMELQGELQKALDTQLGVDNELSQEGVYKLQGSATCIDNSTGNVVAIVGSRSQELSGLNLNRAYQSHRQPGSAIKPLAVYTPYLQLGNTPDTIVKDEKITDGPSNVDGVYSGDITLREAVKTSKNVVAWNIYQQIKPSTGVGILMQMGFKELWYDKDVPAGALGGFTYGSTTEEMAGGYATLANDGVYRKATCVVTIIDSSGQIVVDESKRGVRVFDSNSCRMMTDMLKSAVSEGGTGKSATIENGIIVGKTGTTNANKDKWFCGYSKYYTTAVWTGYDYPKELSGSNLAVKIFREYMESIHTGLPVVDFEHFGKDEEETQPETETASESETETETEDITGETGKIGEAEKPTKDTPAQSDRPIKQPETAAAATEPVTRYFGEEIDATGNYGGDVDATGGGDW